MTNNHTLFDDNKILLNMQRRRSEGSFLRLHVAESMIHRLSEINRDFEKVALVMTDFSGFTQAFPHADRISPYSNRNNISGFLGLEAAHYDLVLSNLDLHRINDPVGFCIQINKALKPDGLFLASLFAGETLHSLRRALLKAESDLGNRTAQRVLPFADIRDLGSVLQRAGFALPVCDIDHLDVIYRDIYHLLRDLRLMGETNCLRERDRRFLPARFFEKANEAYPKNKDGKLTALFDIAFLTGWHPHENQQKPLKPGSASVSMAAALGAVTSPLGSSE